jgi:hypothetical protein
MSERRERPTAHQRSGRPDHGHYIYAVVGGNPGHTLGLRGLEDASAYTIPHCGMAAVVSDIEAQRIRPERRNLAAHRAVLSGLMALEDAVLPMRFGAIAPGTEEIKRLLAANREAFERQLKQIFGKLEMAVRVDWDVPNIFEYFVDKHPELKAARDALFSGSARPSQRDRIELGLMFERLRDEDRLAHTAIVQEALRSQCSTIKPGTLRDDRQIMNLACLVDKNRRGEFEKAVFAAAAHFDNNFVFDYSGPWPPHTFAEIAIES